MRARASRRLDFRFYCRSCRHSMDYSVTQTILKGGKMKRFCVVLFVVYGFALKGCGPVEKKAYQTVVASNAFIKSMRAQHPECVPGKDVPVCNALARATSAKDF